MSSTLPGPLASWRLLLFLSIDLDNLQPLPTEGLLRETREGMIHTAVAAACSCRLTSWRLVGCCCSFAFLHYDAWWYLYMDDTDLCFSPPLAGDCLLLLLCDLSPRLLQGSLDLLLLLCPPTIDSCCFHHLHVLLLIIIIIFAVAATASSSPL